MKTQLHISVRTPEGIWYEGPAQWVRAVSPEGSFEIWPGHAPFVAALSAGDLVVQTPTGLQQQTVQTGFLQVEKDQVLVLLSSA